MEATRTIKNAPRRNMHPTSGVFVERINRIVLLFQDGTSLPPHSKSFKKQRFSTIWTSDTVFGPTRTASVSIADPNATLSFPNVMLNSKQPFRIEFFITGMLAFLNTDT